MKKNTILPEHMELCVFDLCYTLYDSNTTFDFIRYIKKNDIALVFLNNIFVKYLLLSIGKVLKIDVYRYLYIRLLKGISKCELEEFSFRFYNDFLIDRKITPIQDLLNNLQQENNKIILCSASLDVIVKFISEQLNIPYYYGSKLDFDKNNICLGKLSVDLLGKKHLINLDNLGLVVTDNRSDLELIKKSKRCYIISKKNNLKFWFKNNINVDLVL